MKKLIKYSIGLFLLFGLIHALAITIDGVNDDGLNSKASFIIVLGSKVNEDGTLSNRLKARLDKSIELFSESPMLSIFVSGGLGKEGHLEGSKMKEYLVSKNVPEDQIYVDNKGNNTRLTAQNFSKQFPECKSVLVVTQFFHVTRSKLALTQAGVNQVYGFSPDYYEWRDIYATFREIPAYYKYLIK